MNFHKVTTALIFHWAQRNSYFVQSLSKKLMQNSKKNQRTGSYIKRGLKWMTESDWTKRKKMFESFPHRVSLFLFRKVLNPTNTTEMDWASQFSQIRHISIVLWSLFLWHIQLIILMNQIFSAFIFHCISCKLGNMCFGIRFAYLLYRLQKLVPKAILKKLLFLDTIKNGVRIHWRRTKESRSPYFI